MKKDIKKLTNGTGVSLSPADLATSIDYLAERIDALSDSMMALQAEQSEVNVTLSMLAENIDKHADFMASCFFSDGQDAGMADVMAALVFTLRRQVIMWEKMTGVTGLEEINENEDDED